MNRAELPDEDIYRACITWNVPKLRESDRADVHEFLAVVRLNISVLDPERDEPVPARMSPLRRAVEGLKAELNGDPSEAREHYRLVARHRGIRGLLGLLLLAWMNDAGQEDFRRVEARLKQLSGRGARDLMARCHSKLATWATDHGWSELAAHHYDEALKHAGADLRPVLERIGNWFGRAQTFTFPARRDVDMVSFPWIADWADQAAHRAIDSHFKESFRSPWVRTMTFGRGGSVEGVDIQSAELQASWAGAVWLMPSIQRLHSALILGNSRDPSDVARGIALWVRGGGSQIRNLIDANEAHLTAEALAELLIGQLHRGRSVFSREGWADICRSLWDEMPDDLVESMLANYRLPAAETNGYGTDATELYLTAQLLNRSPEVLARWADADKASLGLLTRCLAPSVVEELPRRLSQDLLSAVVSTADQVHQDWRGRGWDVIPRIWLAAGPDAQMRDALLELIPLDAVPEAAINTPQFVPDSVLLLSMRAEIARIHQDTSDAARGRFAGHAVEPTTNVARLLIASHRRDSEAVQSIVDMATSEFVVAQHRLAALNALRELSEHGLLDQASVGDAFAERPIRSFMDDDPSAEQRLENITRLALRARFEAIYDFDADLLAASRDADTRVRRVAVGTISWLSRKAFSSAARDAALLGALYDPHPRVQAAALPAIWDGQFENESLRRVARARVIELWPEAHRDLRLAIVSAISQDVSPADTGEQKVHELARNDRSWLIRRIAHGKGDSAQN
jgi:hypothetical protein